MKVYKRFFILALPMIAQSFLSSSLSFIDNLMIGRLGDVPIAAVGIGGQLVFLFFLIQYGIHTGISSYTAQAWGRGEQTTVKNILGIQLVIGYLPLLVIAAIIYGCPQIVIGIFTEDREVARLATEYLQLVGISLFFLVPINAFTFNLRSTGETKTSLLVSVVSVGFNILLNYLFIFGKWGLPAMGITGAALATVLSRVIEAVLLILLTYRRGYVSAARLTDMFGFSRSLVCQVLKVAFPVILNEMFWALGMSVYTWIYSTRGTEALAAVNIASSLENFFNTPFFGMYSAGAILIGHIIGESGKEAAYHTGRKIVQFLFLTGTGFALFLLLLRLPLLSLYNISEETSGMAWSILTILCLAMPIKITEYGCVVSVFRGGGDTRFALFTDFSGSFLVGIPIGILAVFFGDLPLWSLFALIKIEEVYKCLLSLLRFRSKKWIKVLGE